MYIPEFSERRAPLEPRPIEPFVEFVEQPYVEISDEEESDEEQPVQPPQPEPQPIEAVLPPPSPPLPVVPEQPIQIPKEEAANVQRVESHPPNPVAGVEKFEEEEGDVQAARQSNDQPINVKREQPDVKVNVKHEEGDVQIDVGSPQRSSPRRRSPRSASCAPPLTPLRRGSRIRRPPDFLIVDSREKKSYKSSRSVESSPMKTPQKVRKPRKKSVKKRE